LKSIVQVWPDVTDESFSQVFRCESVAEARSLAATHREYGAHVEIVERERSRPASVRAFRATIAARRREYEKHRREAQKHAARWPR